MTARGGRSWPVVAGPGRLSGVGPAIMIVLLLVIIPVVTCMSGAIAAGGLGFLLKKETDESFEGTELLTMGEQG